MKSYEQECDYIRKAAFWTVSEQIRKGGPAKD